MSDTSVVRSSLLLIGGLTLLWARLDGNVTPAALFSDHAVLQQGVPLPIWGTASEGESVTVEMAGQTVSTVAHDGRWLLRLKPLPAGGPYTMTLSGRNRIVLQDLLVGEVWICSGQSNMERRLGPQPGQQPLVNWEPTVAAADLPRLRHFGVKRVLADTPQSDVQGQWAVCSPATAPEFTAVGFFFGRALQLARGVPVGLIHSSWGGSPAEAWTSTAALAGLPDFAEPLAEQAWRRREPAAPRTVLARRLSRWFEQADPGSNPAAPWSAATVNTAEWRPMTLPTLWEKTEIGDFDGVVWFRKEFELPANWAGRPLQLDLGAIDDADATWVNGHFAGASNDSSLQRHYAVAAAWLKPGRNVIAVRVLDTGGGGGLTGPAENVRLFDPAEPGRLLPLGGLWFYHRSVAFAREGPTAFPAETHGTIQEPSALFNGMIAPLQPYAMRGVVWYQGESNSSRAQQYRTLFPAMIADWRRGWGDSKFPFLYVQIAPHKQMSPEIREAQLLTLKRVANAAMVVTLDVGDAQDIHPAHKQPVGERLALAARALAYGEQVEYSGPLFERAEFQAGRAVLYFTHGAGGLVAPGGELEGFSVCGADKVYHPARAAIVGETVEVSAADVAQPVAVRYAWANVAQGNLFNRAGLPASPFRTDSE